VNGWLKQINPTIISPSKAALEVWKLGCAFSISETSMVVLPHWELAPIKLRNKNIKNARGQIRVAFIGFPVSSKGWPIFSEIVDILASNELYTFYHLVVGGKSPHGNAFGIDCKVTTRDRFSTRDLLKRHEIDVVMVLSPWPETFSYVSAEAVSAGCAIVCFQDSGNVADLVNATGQGLVYESEAKLVETISTGDFYDDIGKILKRSRIFNIKMNQGLFDAPRFSQ